jgi:uncharacterized 2Fe-2S/4Fe-4S cluster protein (DUF4445 family)
LAQVRIRLDPLGREISAEKGAWLTDILHGLGIEFPCGGKGTCGKCKVRIKSGEIEPDPVHLQKLQDLALSPEWRLACMSRADTDLVLEVGQYEMLIQADETPFQFVPGKGYGVAVDVGTTSLVAQLLDLASARVIGVETALNPQSRYGSDLISRLEHAQVHGGELLTSLIRSELGRMLAALMQNRVSSLDRVILVGNTVMQHFFAGADTASLAQYPFESPDLGAREFGAEELGWDPECGRIRFCPSIGSFVGSDILAGIRATDMWSRKEYSVLVDLGTNGEIVVGNREGLWCASTAAGPAFEGAKISMGMLASNGAISSVNHGPIGIRCEVIGNVTARGICGSGLIDAVSVLLERGAIGGFGEILSGEPTLSLTGKVALTQKDIQEFLLAKAAIASGLHILMRKLGIGAEDIADVYIAGAFGNYINLERMIHTGMMDFPPDRLHKLGNTALIGAKMFLFSDSDVEDQILSCCRHVNLESEKDFQDIFTDRLSFTPPSS